MSDQTGIGLHRISRVGAQTSASSSSMLDDAENDWSDTALALTAAIYGQSAEDDAVPTCPAEKVVGELSRATWWRSNQGNNQNDQVGKVCFI